MGTGADLNGKQSKKYARTSAAKTQPSPRPGKCHLNKTEVSAPPRTGITQAVVIPAPSAPSNVSCRHCYSIKAHCYLMNTNAGELCPGVG